MPDALVAIPVLLVSAVVLTVVSVRFGILLGGRLARRLDRDDEQEEDLTSGPAS